MLFGLFCRPIIASAADTATIRIVKDGSTYGELPPELIPFFLILIGLDYYYGKDHFNNKKSKTYMFEKDGKYLVKYFSSSFLITQITSKLFAKNKSKLY